MNAAEHPEKWNVTQPIWDSQINQNASCEDDIDFEGSSEVRFFSVIYVLLMEENVYWKFLTCRFLQNFITHFKIIIYLKKQVLIF